MIRFLRSTLAWTLLKLAAVVAGVGADGERPVDVVKSRGAKVALGFGWFFIVLAVALGAGAVFFSLFDSNKDRPVTWVTITSCDFAVTESLCQTADGEMEVRLDTNALTGTSAEAGAYPVSVPAVRSGDQYVSPSLYVTNGPINLYFFSLLSTALAVLVTAFPGAAKGSRTVRFTASGALALASFGSMAYLRMQGNPGYSQMLLAILIALFGWMRSSTYDSTAQRNPASLGGSHRTR